MAEQTAADKSKGGVKKYYRDTIAELKKVIWPNRQQTTNNTLAVIGAVFVIGLVIWLFDLALGGVFTKFILSK